MSTAYRFERFELQPTRRRLLENGRPVALGQRAFDVLLMLVERAGELVSKDELLAMVWPGMVVEENNLQVQVSALRKAAMDRARTDPRCVRGRACVRSGRSSRGGASYTRAVA
jgi:DNA-binding winged helix-turn-helix (wHTH) protein